MQNYVQKTVYGGSQCQGLGLNSICTTIGIEYISALLEHTWMGTPTGTLIKASMEQTKLELSVHGNLFNNDY